MAEKMLKRFVKNDRGTAAIEFAIVALPFLLIILAIMEIGAKTLMQSELDHAIHDVSRSYSRENDEVTTLAAYKQDVVCPKLSPLLDCDKLLFGVDSFNPNSDIFSHYKLSFVGRWNTGCGGYTSVLEMYYPITNILFDFAVADVVTYEEKEYYRSRILLRREPGVKGNGKMWHKTAGVDAECTGDLT